jgi:HK97 family phage prohead protease
MTEPALENTDRTAAEERYDAGLEVKRFDEETGVFHGFAAIFNVMDVERDVILPGAFSAAIKKKGVKGIRLLWQHDPREPIGVLEDLTEDDTGLFFRARLALGTQRGREAYELLKMGAVDRMSIGFSLPSRRAVEMDNENGRRIIRKVDLWELSIVTFPAQPKARVSAVKSVVAYQDLPLAERARSWDWAGAEQRVRSWAGAGEGLESAAAQHGYRRAFVWYDRENVDQFGAYKLQIADAIDGALTAVPRAIFAAAAAVMGARGGVDVPESDMEAVRRHLERYYAKMREEFDDETIAAPWGRRAAFADLLKAHADLIETDRDFEAFLTESGFSARRAHAIASAGFRAASRQRDPAGRLDELVTAVKRATRVLTRPEAAGQP